MAEPQTEEVVAGSTEAQRRQEASFMRVLREWAQTNPELKAVLEKQHLL